MRPVVREIPVVHLRVVTPVPERVVLRVPIPAVGRDDISRGSGGEAISDHLVGEVVGYLGAGAVGSHGNRAGIGDVSAGSPPGGTGGSGRVVELRHVDGS